MSLDWLATRPDGHYHANQCRAWAAAFDGFRYRGHTAADAASGARAVVETMATALVAAGVPPAQIRTTVA